MKDLKYLQKLAWITLGIASVWAFVLFSVLKVMTPYNPLSATKESKANLVAFFPQGWAFFTRNPREANTFMYKVENGQLTPAIETNASISNWFGIRKETRVKGVEMGALLGRLDKKPWTECPEGINSFEQVDSLESVRIINGAPKPHFCGEYLLETREPVPWAWAKIMDKVKMPSNIIKINALCIN